MVQSMFDSFLTTQNASKAVARQVARIVPHDAPLLSFGLTLTLRHYARPDVVEFYYQDGASLDALTRAKPVVYVLIDVGNVEGQWRGRKPEANLRWLSDHTTLTPMADFPPYTLFRAARATPSP